MDSMFDKEEIMNVLQMMTEVTDLHNEYLTIFETITPDDFFRCKEHYTNLEGSGPDERDCDVSNSIEARVLEDLEAILIKNFDNIIIMPTDAFTMPAIKNSHEYMEDKIQILEQSNSIQDCINNFKKYYKALLN